VRFDLQQIDNPELISNPLFIGIVNLR
jgi:hypothetical protein